MLEQITVTVIHFKMCNSKCPNANVHTHKLVN